jgi:multidrug efflux pump subunit AcrB
MQLVPIAQNGQNGVPRGTPPRGQAPADEPQPDIAVQLENGQIAHTYSAEQQAKRDQWFLGQLDGKLGKELQPFREYQQQQEYRAFLGGIDQQARQDFAEVAQNEAFDQLRPQIAAIMKSDKRYTLDKAYNRAYREHYLPTRDTKIRQQTLDEQTQKARAANSSLTPTRRTTAESGAQAPMTTTDILRQKAAELGIQP